MPHSKQTLQSTELYHQNLVLRELARKGFSDFIARLETSRLSPRFTISRARGEVKFTYFPLSGMISVMGLLGKKTVELGVIGAEGITGTAAFFGGNRLPFESYVQVPGQALRVDHQEFRAELETDRSFREAMLPFVHNYIFQMTECATANACCSIKQRLTRKILMTQDRLKSDVLPLTHEILAASLAVRRPSISLVLAQLEKEGSLATERGRLRVVDREQLVAIAGSVYTPVVL